LKILVLRIGKTDAEGCVRTRGDLGSRAAVYGGKTNKLKQIFVRHALRVEGEW
jgi:hypothetical protein